MVDALQSRARQQPNPTAEDTDHGSVPPGWYPDPFPLYVPGQLRWWDGASWTPWWVAGPRRDISALLRLLLLVAASVGLLVGLSAAYREQRGYYGSWLVRERMVSCGSARSPASDSEIRESFSFVEGYSRATPDQVVDSCHHAIRGARFGAATLVAGSLTLLAYLAFGLIRRRRPTLLLFVIGAVLSTCGFMVLVMTVPSNGFFPT